jgi:hypothetical protein
METSLIMMPEDKMACERRDESDYQA